MRLRAGDQDHGVAGHPYAVDEDDAVRLVNDLGHRPDRPEGGRPPPERASLTRHVALGFLRQQPADELPQPGRLVVVADRPRRAAAPAAPSLGPRPGLAVPLHRSPAARALHALQEDSSRRILKSGEKVLHQAKRIDFGHTFRPSA